jgi:hypothetical protein
MHFQSTQQNNTADADLPALVARMFDLSFTSLPTSTPPPTLEN